MQPTVKYKRIFRTSSRCAIHTVPCLHSSSSMDPEIEKALYDIEAADEYEANRCQELAEELELFDLKERSPSPDEDEESELDVQFYLAPAGIAIFKNDIHSLYTEDDLLWPFKDDTDPFLSVIDRSVVKECIEKGYFMREVSSANLLVEYVFHTMCCTSDEKMRYSSYNTIMYLINTCKSVPNIRDQLHLALVNLGADVSNLKVDMSGYRSLVIPDSCDPPQGKQLTMGELRKILVLVLQFLSMCLANCEKHVDQHPDELILLLIALGLDPKVIDVGLDAHIGACISHSLSWYPTDEDFLQSLKCLVRKVLEYCGYDVLSVVHLCRAYIIPTHRGKILQMALTFHQLQVHLTLQDEDFVHDIQAKNVVDLLTKFFERPDREKTTYHSYYIITLLDLCFHDDFLLRPDHRSDIIKICDLIRQAMGHVQLSADDVHSAVITWYVSHVILKWKRPAGIERMGTDMTQRHNGTEQSQKSVEPHENDKDLKECDVEQVRRKLVDCTVDNATEVCGVAKRSCRDSTGEVVRGAINEVNGQQSIRTEL